jgi:hypothetical protein
MTHSSESSDRNPVGDDGGSGDDEKMMEISFCHVERRMFIIVTT